ncbi:MAG: hypothetical protein LBV33_01380 [Lachnospiraceae bacterium]|jgi:hypothetical protein|nr:hypothetical protein [Lachnospiraceae bacterium]
MSNDLTKGAVFSCIREFLEQFRREYNTEFHVVFYTSIGKIVCDLEPPASKRSLLGFADDPTTFTVDISAMFDGTGLFDSQLINIKNAIIYKNNSDEELMRTEQMVLFADHILGFNLIRQKN